MGIVVNVTEAPDASGSGEGFEPIPAGNYPVTIIPADSKIGEYNSEGAGEGRPNYNVCFRISDGEFKNRRLWATIPLFERWGKTEKNPKGSVAFTFFEFFRALGREPKTGEAFEVPTLSELGGEPLVVKVVVKKHYTDPDKKVNEVKSFFSPKDGGNTSATTEKASTTFSFGGKKE